MTKHIPRLALATLAFSLGLAFVGALSLSDPHSSATPPESDQSVLKTTAIVQTAPVAPCPVFDRSGFPNLVADTKWRGIENGQRLPPDLGDGREINISGSEVVPISNRRTLVKNDNFIGMLDKNFRVIWKFAEDANPIYGLAFIDATNLVYATGGDNRMFILDGTTGDVLFRNARNGRAAYGVPVPYNSDQCLITDDSSGYRDDPDDSSEPMKDGLTAWRGTKMLWYVDFPPDAELVVNGNRILAITKTKTGIYVKEIKPPM